MIGKKKSGLWTKLLETTNAITENLPITKHKATTCMCGMIDNDHFCALGFADFLEWCWLFGTCTQSESAACLGDCSRTPAWWVCCRSTTLAKNNRYSREIHEVDLQFDPVISCDIELRFDIDATRGSCASRACVATCTRKLQIEVDVARYHMIALHINLMSILAVTIFLARVVQTSRPGVNHGTKEDSEEISAEKWMPSKDENALVLTERTSQPQQRLTCAGWAAHGLHSHPPGESINL